MLGEYGHLLDPQLYDNNYVSSFVEELLESGLPSEDQLNEYTDHLTPLDSVMDELDLITKTSEHTFKQKGFFDPAIVAIVKNCDKHRSFINYEPIPTTQTDVLEFIAKIKTLAFVTGSQMIFCSHICYHHNGILLHNSDDFTDANLGIYTVGSFIKNNKMSLLSNISEHSFEEIRREIVRENYDLMGCFYSISDITEFERIIRLIPSFCNKFPGDDLDLKYMNNFATVMAASAKFNQRVV
jgi:hypothetical protein